MNQEVEAGAPRSAIARLSDKWRARTNDKGYEVYAQWAFNKCAEELDAALRACAEAPATDGKYFFPLTGKRPCPDCGQPEGVQLNLGATGYSVGSGFQHTPECKQNFCPHGIAWSEDCGRCAMARIEEGE